ncbi:invasion associated locus B family protein [Dongia sp.]|uniref:invasion associated locus B family protein n=1 Tax=Dongia sp. TaxID=1977262 RepID=UPI0035B40948
MRLDCLAFARKLLLTLLVAAGLVAAGTLAPAYAETPKNLGAFKKWRAMTVNADGNRTCYAMSQPVDKKGNVKDRGQVAAMVTHFPEIGALDQVSIVLGFSPQAKSPVIVKIGGFTFKFTETEDDRAWAKTRADDKALVQAMRKSNQMVVTATTRKGLKVQDTYDLSGFTKAYQTMSKACTS